MLRIGKWKGGNWLDFIFWGERGRKEKRFSTHICCCCCQRPLCQNYCLTFMVFCRILSHFASYLYLAAKAFAAYSLAFFGCSGVWHKCDIEFSVRAVLGWLYPYPYPIPSCHPEFSPQSPQYGACLWPSCLLWLHGVLCNCCNLFGEGSHWKYREKYKARGVALRTELGVWEIGRHTCCRNSF